MPELLLPNCCLDVQVFLATLKELKELAMARSRQARSNCWLLPMRKL